MVDRTGMKDGSTAVKEAACLIFCIFWYQLPNQDKSLTCMIILEKKVMAQIQNLFAYVRGRKKMLDCEGDVRVERSGCQQPGKEL